MTKAFNPWINMNINSQRRIDKNLNYDFFWIRDIEGKYGFFIDSTKILQDDKIDISLKGISIKKVSIDANNSRLYLILNDNTEYEIFLTLCQDLINTANKYDNNQEIIEAVENRLRRWQQLLKSNNYSGLTLERQMGLFSELIFLKNKVASEIGIKDAIISWVGPDFDKQDFSIESATIEVKSYKTTKGEIIYISSLQQLQSPKNPLYLATYGLTISERGLSILDIIESIENQISDDWILDQFKIKLFEYGYIEGVSNKNRLYKFLINKESIYEVSAKFPKIEKNNISNKIISVKYGIDLSECKEFQVDFDSIFEAGGAI
ncbi:PD-(D/E)XK motif protein [Terrisporobacter petrolearius]|uniref:PD-(D/E)XK motif protein n=1 Tax=Terrisporobacter petrolearius TaxID=1460447 RepID=UPI001D165BE2|nr:PD-(D/E)XK motif protein [Terrisporobacter petrolearius]MCC3863902.1 PD-(D/E)XK motif protein [Terrisporobacter petrolearius]